MENQTQNQIVLNQNTESPLEINNQTGIGDTTQEADLSEKFSDTVTVTNEKNVKNTIIQNITETGDKKIEIISDEVVPENSELYEVLQNKLKTFKNDFKSLVGVLQTENDSMVGVLQTENEQIDDSNLDKTSLSLLADYGTSSTDESSSDSDSDSDGTDTSDSSTEDSCPVISNTNDNRNFRSNKSIIYPDTDSSSSSSSSDDEVSFDSDSTDNESIKIISSNANEKKSPIQRRNKKTEPDLSDLPPIENLQISVPESVCVELGNVVSIVEEQVVIAALPNMPPLDIDTVLFLNKGGDTLGKIFDIFGPVNNPMYTVRFNNKEDILNKNIKVGTQVFCAPTTEHTSYVLVADLMKVKGSDASWKEDLEPPSHLLDYSDDEEERRMRAKRKNKQNNIDDDSSDQTSSPKRVSEFEKRKNERNLYLNERFNNKKKPYNENNSVRPRGFDFTSKWTDHRNRGNIGSQYHTPPPSCSTFRPRHWSDGSPGPSRFINPVCHPQMYPPMPYHPYFGNNTSPYGPPPSFPPTASSNITTPRPDFNLFCAAPYYFAQSQILAPPPPPPPPKQNNNSSEI